MYDIAVLIPCYNEAMTIGEVVREWKRALLPTGCLVRVYVYDNNSTDGTEEAAKAAGAIVRKERRQGKGNVIRTMFRDVEADCYLMVDGDGTYAPDQAAAMASMVLKEGADLVIGERASYHEENTRRFHSMGNHLVKKCINMIFGSSQKDIMTGCRAMSRRFVKTFPVTSRGFEVETEMTVHALDRNMSMAAVSVNYQERRQGSCSKLQTIPDGLRVLRTIFDLFMGYRPFLFFSILALLLGIPGVCFFGGVLKEFAKTGMVLRMPTLIVSCSLVFTAILSFFTGVILDQIHKKERRDFEHRLLTLPDRDYGKTPV